MTEMTIFSFVISVIGFRLSDDGDRRVHLVQGRWRMAPASWFSWGHKTQVLMLHKFVQNWSQVTHARHIRGVLYPSQAVSS